MAELMSIEDIQVLKPHFVSLVPRVLNRIYQSVIVAADAPGLKGAMFRKAVADKLHNLRSMLTDHHRQGRAIWERFTTRRASDQFWYYGRLVEIFEASGVAPLLTADMRATLDRLRTVDMHAVLR